MKTSRVVAIGIVMVAIFLCWFNTLYAGHDGQSLWPNKQGEIYLKNISNGECVRLAIFRTVGNNYIVHGFVTETGEGEHNSLFNGNAIVDGNKILMHVTSSGYKGTVNNNNVVVTEVYGSIGRVELNTSDLKGWVLSINFHCDPLSNLCTPEDYADIQYLEPTSSCP
jgi:hypothetical protein